MLFGGERARSKTLIICLGIVLLLSSLSIEYLLSPVLRDYFYANSTSLSGSSSLLSSFSYVPISPDVSVILPKGGVLYRLGGIQTEQIEKRATSATNIRRSIHVTIEVSTATASAGVPSWDMLWSDYHGAFGQRIVNTTVISIPWREPHSPLFLVLYNGGDDADVRYVVEDSQRASKEALQVVQIDNDEVFRYPRRELNFRSRLSRTDNSTGAALVTLCTQLTPERLPYLEQIAKAWRGPISAVIYVGFRSDQSQELQTVGNFWDNGPTDVRSNVDLHLVYDDKRPWFATGSDENNRNGQNPYPINLLRQVAIEAARTEWVYLIEADMLPRPDAHSIIEDTWDDMMNVYEKNGRGSAFIVPLYKSYDNIDANTLNQLPTSKKTLLSQTVKSQTIAGGNAVKGNVLMRSKSVDKTVAPKFSYARAGTWHATHRLMDYKGWEALTDGNKTFLPFHESGNKGTICNPPKENYSPQEPYYIAKKEDMTPFNVLFAGMYWDKVAQQNDMCNCRFAFYIHPELFSVLFRAPPTSNGFWASMFGKIGWRQQFVFGLQPVYFQEVWKAKLSQGIANRGESPCAQMATVDEEDLPFPAWIPTHSNASLAAKPNAFRIVAPIQI